MPRRCVRPDETSATVRVHYLKDGTARFAFIKDRAEYFLPVGTLLKCFLEASDAELYARLLAFIPLDPGARPLLPQAAALFPGCSPRRLCNVPASLVHLSRPHECLLPCILYPAA